MEIRPRKRASPIRLTASGRIAGAVGFWVDRRRLTHRNPDLRVTSIDQRGAPTPAVRAIEIERQGSTLSSRSLQATATGRNARLRTSRPSIEQRRPWEDGKRALEPNFYTL